MDNPSANKSIKRTMNIFRKLDEVVEEEDDDGDVINDTMDNTFSIMVILIGLLQSFFCS
jgi:flagellin-specific chaperone FliS